MSCDEPFEILLQMRHSSSERFFWKINYWFYSKMQILSRCWLGVCEFSYWKNFKNS
jgi:hypothetical protein